jgi:hypothetical protein
MSNDQTPQEEAKGLSPIAWVAVGCSGVLILGAVTALVVGSLVLNKTKQLATEGKAAPVVTAARLIAAANPEIELVEADAERRIVTFRNTRTDELYTADFEDVENGTVRFFSEDGSVSLELDSGEDDDDSLIITTEDSIIRLGAGGSAEEVPPWVPAYPGTTPQGAITSDDYAGHWGAYTFTVGDNLQEILDFYTAELEKLDLEITSRTTTPKGALLTAQNENESRMMTVTASVVDDEVQVLIQYNEK